MLESYSGVTEAEKYKISYESQHPPKHPKKHGRPGEPYISASLGAMCEVGSDGRWVRDVGNS